MRRVILASGLLVLISVPARADEPTLQGDWRTSLGVVTFTPEGNVVVATFANPGIPPVKGSVKGKTATLTYQEGPKRGEATLTIDESGRSFSGWFQIGGGSRNPWNGWRPDPE